jgi:hypothetical protein
MHDPENAAKPCRHNYIAITKSTTLPVPYCKCSRCGDVQPAAKPDAVEVVASYKSFTDGMEAAAQICGSLAETTYDDADAFEAATGCEAAIMRVVKEQRREQAALGAKP